MNIYKQCPKCQYAPLPEDQSLPATCPACGLVLAKHAQIQMRAREIAARRVNGQAETIDNPTEDLDEIIPLWKEYLFPQEKINPVVTWARIGLWLFFAIWGWRLMMLNYKDAEINSSFIHGPLLVFHEAGHVVFRLFGEFIMVLGGTLGQLIMPTIIGIALLIRRDAFGAAIGLWFLGVSFLDVAPYVYDSIDPQIMLLSGTTGEEGGHDWIFILKAMGILNKAHLLGSLIHKLGSGLILLSLAWGICIWWPQSIALYRGQQD